MSQIKKDTFKHSHKKYNVFFSNWSVIPNNKRRGYYSSNKKEGVNLLNYMADPHGEVNKDYKFGDFLKLNSPNVFDEKKGHVDNTEVLAPVHKNSIIFTGIISFDFQRSMNEVSKIKWEKIANITYNELCKINGWNPQQWEMQSILHTNTLNYHLQIRLYQNNKTPLTDIQNKWTIKPESYLKVKAKINKYLQLQIHKPVRAIINKRLSLEQQHNNEVYQTYNRYAQDILHLCNQGENATNKKITIKLTNIYFNQNKYISNWIQKIGNSNNLKEDEIKTITTMVKNNIKNNIIDNLQDYQKERVIDYVEIGRSGKNFKNFNKISHKLQFNKLDKYSAKLIKEIYAPAISQMVNTVLHKDNLNSKEIKDTVSSYVKSLQKTRPLVDKELDLGL